MSVADELSDRVGLIFQGKIVSLDTPEKLKCSLEYKSKVTLVTNRSIQTVLSDYRDLTILSTKHANGEFTTTVTMSNGQTGLDIMDYVRDRGYYVGNFEVAHASLEDVFLSYTGRTLEDQESNNGEEVIES